MGIASLVPEGVQRELMPEPAVGKRLGHLEDTAHSEMGFITNLAMGGWIGLAALFLTVNWIEADAAHHFLGPLCLGFLALP